MLTFLDILSLFIEPQYRNGYKWIAHHVVIHPDEYDYWLKPDVHYLTVDGIELSVCVSDRVDTFKVFHFPDCKVTFRDIACAIYSRDAKKSFPRVQITYHDGDN